MPNRSGAGIFPQRGCNFLLGGGAGLKSQDIRFSYLIHQDSVRQMTRNYLRRVAIDAFNGELVDPSWPFPGVIPDTKDTTLSLHFSTKGLF